MRRITQSVVFAVLIGLASAPALAAPITFFGADPSVGPGGARPLSDAAAAAYDAAAALLGSPNLITLEALAPGNFAILALDPVVTATLFNTDVTDGPGINDGTSPHATLGYNTTAAGDTFLRIIPNLDSGTAGLNLAFSTPIQAFGAYLAGLGTASGNLFVVFNDGAPQELAVVGTPGGGVLFFGFTSAGTEIHNVRFELRGVIATRDVFSVDDLRYTTSGPAVAEPTTLALLGFGLAAAAYRRRRNC